MKDLDGIRMVEAATLMAGVDAEDICIERYDGTLNYRIDAHLKANIKQEDIKEVRKAFKFLLNVATTLELKEIEYTDFHLLSFFISPDYKKVYQAYLDRIKKIATTPIEIKRIQYDLEKEIPLFVRKHINQFYKEKAMTMEELQCFQIVHYLAYRYFCIEYRNVYFKESEIRAILKKYRYTDKHFNPALNNIGNSEHSLIEWIGNGSDFACIIELLREKKYISAKISYTESLRIAVKHFSGVNETIHSLMQMKRTRKKNTHWFDDANGFPEATPPKGKSKKRRIN